MRNRLGGLLASALCLALALSQVDAQNPDATRRPARPDLFRVERPVYPGASGPNRLDIDLTLLSATEPFHVMNGAQYGQPRYVGVGGLTDFRLYTPDGGEVPYVLIPPYTLEPTWWPSGKPLPIPATDTASGFEVDLGRAMSADRVEVRGLPSKFLKRVRLEGSGDRVRWTLLVPEATLFSLPDEGLLQLALEFAAGEYRYFRLIWDDRNSARVPLPSDLNVRMTLPPGLASTPLRAAIPFERVASEPRVSRYRLRLPAPRLPIVALELSVAGGNVLRRAEVHAVSPGTGSPERMALGGGMLRRAVVGAVAASELRITVRQPTTAELELVVQDGDNPPLALEQVTAVFALLPYIHFESQAGQAIVARYGADAIDWPRYDLEAIKDSVYTLRAATASWGEPNRRDLQLVTAPAQSTDTAARPAIPARGTVMDPLAFRRRRAIPAGPAGHAIVRLDAPVLAHSKRYADLRILDAEHRQVAYLLENVRDSVTIDLGVPEKLTTNAATQRGVTRYRVRIPYAGLPDGRLVLATSDRVFGRRVWLEAQHPAGRGRREPWVQRMTEGEWRHDDPASAAPPLLLRFPTTRIDSLELVVEEGDNTPLSITSAQLVLPTHRLRFVRPDTTPLTLVYGNEDLSAPRYDLALLRTRLSGADAHEVTLGPEEGITPRGPSQIPMIAFWAILATAVVGMLVMIWRLIGRGPVAPDVEPLAKGGEGA